MTFTSPKNSQSSSKERQTISLSIDENLISLRGLSPTRLRFEIEYGLERGTTANSFLFSADNNSLKNTNYPAVLVHPPGSTFKDVFLDALRDSLVPKCDELWIVIGHINPNRIDMLRSLAKIYPNIKLICSVPGEKLLKELWSLEKPSSLDENKVKKTIPPLPKIQTIKKQEVLSIGHEYKLQLIPAPTPRWPGGLLAFEKTLGLLMSDKFFAAHVCTKNWEEANRSSTEEDRRYYYDCLMAPMANQVDKLVEKLEELDIRTIAPGHGPAIEGSWRSLLNDYRRWDENQQNYSIKVALLFASAYGNTAAIADALANGIRKTGIQVESLNCEFTPANELLKAIQESDAYLIGSPTLGGHAPTPIVSALGVLIAEGNKEKPVGIFGSYGWSGEALELLESKLSDSGFKFGFEPIKIKFSPNSAMVKKLEETGTIFGRSLIKEQKNSERRTSGGISASRSNPTVLALGRIVGSLCILTARKNNENEILTGAMVASWVSQASFSPPGISIAVAKDRAVESLLHRGDNFTLNILANGKQHELMKKFLKPFPPGADRFSGITIQTSPSAQPILPEALAWLEGSVQERMECGDHWLIYAEIRYGKVLDSDRVTAVHHRRTGATY